MTTSKGGRPLGHKLSQETKDQMSASHRARAAAQRPVRMFAKKVADAASRGDMGEIYGLLDTYVSGQGRPLTDDELMQMMKAMFDRLRDKDAALNALSDGLYGQMLSDKSAVARLNARKALLARHEQNR